VTDVLAGFSLLVLSFLEGGSIMKKLTILTVTFLFVMSTVGYAAQSMSALTSQLKQATNGRAKISYHNKTGMVRALSVKDGFALPQPFTLPLNITAENAARSFLAMYGSLFGIQDQSKELKLERQKKGLKDRSVLRFQQVYKGIPVMAGELIVHLDALKSVLSVNGEIAPRPLIDTSATISASEAEETALALVAKSYKVDQSELTASEPELWIYNPALLGTWPNQDILVWRMEVTAKELLPIDELVLIDANNGSVALNFNQINYAKDRVIYNGYNNYLCDFDLCGPPWYEGEPPTGDNDVDNIYEYLGDAYDFYFNQFGRKSIDNKEMSIIATARYCSPIHECPLKNAMWSPSAKKLAFGQYVNADDWIGHEYTHGVTQYESNLFYYMQSGAINESLSDIFGEFIDLTNGSGFDDPSAKWIFGEELYLYLGNYRNIKDPTNSFDLNGGGEQPDKMSSTYYLCGSGDNGGVHKNDGIGNKAAYLITDGDTFNGKTVSGIGLDKTARLYYLVQTKCLTSGSDYADLYTCLQSACEYLKDVGYVTESDCQQVTNAIDAVEMDQQPTQCAALEAPYCDTDKHIKWFYYDDFESGAVGWVPSDLSLWEVSEKYAVSKSHSLHGKDAGYSSYASTFSPVIGPLPANAYLHFKHAYHFEYSDTENCDGGIIGYSTDGGNNWYDAESLIVDNGYNGEITSITNNFL